MAAPETLDAQAIMALLPHRYPFLLIDRIVELHPREKVIALKNVTVNEPFFPGHFPGQPVMPGVLIIEALAQAGAVLLLREVADRGEKLVYFTGIDKGRFRKAVLPGDQIRFEVDVIKIRTRNCKMRGRALVDGQLVAEAEIMSALVPRES